MLSLTGMGSPAAGEPGRQRSIDVAGRPVISDASHGQDLYVGVGREVVVVDTRSDVVTARFEVGPRIEEVVVDASRKRIFVLHHARGWGARGAIAALSFDGEILARERVGRGATGMDVDSSSGYVYVANWNSQDIYVHDAETLERLSRLGGRSWLNDNRGWPTDVVVDRRLGKAFVTTTEGYVFILSGTTIMDRSRLVHTSDDARLEIDPHRHLLYLTSYEIPYIMVMDARSLRRVGKIRIPHLSPEIMALDHVRGVGAILGLPRPEREAEGMEVRFVDTRTGEELGVVPLDMSAEGIATVARGWRFFVGGGEDVQVVSLDGRPPETRFGTAEGALLERDDSLVGTVADDESGVRHLTLELTGVMGARRVEALLRCSRHRRCSWTMPPPDAPGTYQVRPVATDRARNIESATEPITVTWMP